MQGRQPIHGSRSTAAPKGSNCPANTRVRSTWMGDGGASRAANSAPVGSRTPNVIGVTTNPQSMSATGCDKVAPSSSAKCWTSGDHGPNATTTSRASITPSSPCTCQPLPAAGFRLRASPLASCPPRCWNKAA
ncbi:hypothetical protein G6F23_014675 [Rhizopus arrhizus]|nr:hypothetical protein G6F23_014675 [Rhizopus arrhizus]